MRISEGVRPDDVRAVLGELPSWFGIPESNEEYAEAATRLAGFTAYDGDEAVGVALVERLFATTYDLHLLAVRPARHRRGVGRALVERVRDHARAQGASLLTVHTVGPSFEDAGYARTRDFYAALGFLPVLEAQLDWSGPTLVLAHPL